MTDRPDKCVIVHSLGMSITSFSTPDFCVVPRLEPNLGRPTETGARSEERQSPLLPVRTHCIPGHRPICPSSVAYPLPSLPVLSTPSAAPKPGAPLGNNFAEPLRWHPGSGVNKKYLSRESVIRRSGAVSCKRSVWLRPGDICDAGIDRETRQHTLRTPARPKDLLEPNKQCNDLPCQNLARKEEIIQLPASLTCG